MTLNAASRLRSLEDRSAALGSRRCQLPGMHSVPKSAVLPYASGVGGLSRRLLNNYNKQKLGARPRAETQIFGYFGLLGLVRYVREDQQPAHNLLEEVEVLFRSTG